MVSDLMQKAMLLHASTFMVVNRQQGADSRAGGSSGASSGRNWAPREAEQLLEQLQFPLACGSITQRLFARRCRTLTLSWIT